MGTTYVILCPLCRGTGEVPRMRGTLRRWDVHGGGGKCMACGGVGLVQWNPPIPDFDATEEVAG